MDVKASTVLAYLALDTTRYKKGMAEAIRSVKDLESSALGASGKMEVLSRSMQSAGSILTKTLTTSIVAMGTAAVKTFSGFDDSMRQVQATMGATGDEFEQLADAAKEAGATTRYTASEAAQALNYLALAGYDSEKAIAALPQVLRLAQAGGMDLAYTSDLLTDSMSALGKETSYMTEFSDQLAMTSRKSNTSISQLGEAILTIGGTAKMLKGDTVELNTALGILADNGIKGAEGGTHLRNIILSLTSPTAAAQKVMERLGLAVYDANGNMRGMQEIMGDINKAMDGMTDAQRQSIIADLFNKTDLAAAQDLLGTTKERWDELTAAITNSEGTAQEMSDAMEGGIGGAFRNLSSAVEAVGVEIGENLAPAVQGAADWVTGLARSFAGLSDETQNTIIGVGTVVAAIGPALMIGGKVITMASGIASALGTIVPILTGPVGIVMAVGAAGYALYRLHRNINNMDLADDLQKVLDSADKEVVGEMTAVINTTIELRNADGTELDLADQLPSIYDAMATALTDGKPDTETVLDEQETAIREYYQAAVDKVNAWREDELAGLDTTAADYEANVASINAKAEEMITSFRRMENSSIVWLKSNANRATGVVKGNLGQLEEIKAAALDLATELDTMAADASRKLSETERMAEHAKVIAKEAKQEEIVKDAAEGLADYTEASKAEEERYADELAEIRQRHRQLWRNEFSLYGQDDTMEEDVTAAKAAHATREGENRAKTRKWLAEDMRAIAEATVEPYMKGFIQQYDFSDWTGSAAEYLKAAGRQNYAAALDNLDFSAIPEHIFQQIAEDMGMSRILSEARQELGEQQGLTDWFEMQGIPEADVRAKAGEYMKERLVFEGYDQMLRNLEKWSEFWEGSATYALQNEKSGQNDELMAAIRSAKPELFEKLDAQQIEDMMWGSTGKAEITLEKPLEEILTDAAETAAEQAGKEMSYSDWLMQMWDQCGEGASFEVPDLSGVPEAFVEQFYKDLGDAIEKHGADLDPDTFFRERIGYISENMEEDFTGIFYDAGTQAADAASEAMESAFDDYNGIHSPSTLYMGKGQFIGEGLKLGLRSKLPELRKAAIEMAASVQDTFSQELGIHSPSRVMKRLGEYAVAGLREGLGGGTVSQGTGSYTNNAQTINVSLKDARISSENDIDALARKLANYSKRISYGKGVTA